MLLSCGDSIPLKNESGNKRKKGKKSTDTTQVSEAKVDSIINKSITDTTKVTAKPSIANYKCKYPDMVQQILLIKRTAVFEKEGRDISFYSDAFLNIFEVDKTRPEILIFYDNIIDSEINKISFRGKIHFNNISSNTEPIITVK